MSVAKERQKECNLLARRHKVLLGDVHALVTHRKYVLVDGIHATTTGFQPSELPSVRAGPALAIWDDWWYYEYYYRHFLCGYPPKMCPAL
jgi:hypothetical protein